jgi:spoIIIJ-associated protein
MNPQKSASAEFSGRNVEDAVAKAARALGIAPNEVSYQVVEDTTRSILGLVISGLVTIQVRVPENSAPPVTPAPVTPAPVTPAPVEVTPPTRPAPRPVAAAKPAVSEPRPVARPAARPVAVRVPDDEDAASQERNPPELEEVASDVLSTLLDKMGMLGAVEVVDHGGVVSSDPQEVSPLLLNVVGDDLGGLIGRRGETLRDLQFMVRLIVSRKIGVWPNVVVDVESYKGRREETLRSLAERMADQARRTERPVVLEPMPAHERRIIHLALRDAPGVHTESTGEGEHRKVQIFPN